MKKTVFSLVALLTMVSLSYAQDEKGYIGISLGPSIPMGDFSSRDVDNEDAGFANAGPVFDISYAHKLGEGNFGLTALLRGQSNPTDAQAIADVFAYEFPEIGWKVEGNQWAIRGLMLGGFGSFPISKKSSFDTRAMIGFVSASSPELNITGTGPRGTLWVNQKSTPATSFAYLIGAGFKFDIASNLYLLTNLDYLGSNPEFLNVETIASDGSREKDTFSQRMGTLNLSVGIALKI